MKSRFFYSPTVSAKDIDALGHVNNEVYLRWLIEAAVAHSSSLGYTLEKFFELKAAFVVRRHELDYLTPVFKDDQIRVETWIVPFEGSRAVRHYEIFNQKGGKPVMTGKTMWVYVSLQTGRPLKIPDSVLKDFSDPRAEK
jgi:acyl-CoA thioester hydrolase